MTEAVVVALITGGVALVGNILTMISNNKLMEFKIDELREDFADLRDRVNKHNNLVERLTIVEQSTKSAHKRLDDLKDTH